MQEYNKTDQRLHQLCQLLAKAGRSYVPKREDDSHSNLYFDAINQRIKTHPFGTPARTLCFNLYTNSFEWVDARQQATLIIKLAGQSWEQLENIIAGQLLESQLDQTSYLQPLHFEIPDYDSLPAIFTPFSDDAVAEWSYYRRLANQVGAAVLGLLDATGQARIWPHHFDTGTYCTVDDFMGIGYGLAMQDTIVDAPYFYVYGYSEKKEIDYSQLPALPQGEWKMADHWKGAVLPITALPGKGSMKVINQFVREAIEWYLD